MKYLFLIIVASVLASSGCPAPANQPPSTTPWAPSWPAADPRDCPDLCAHYRTLKCPAGDPTPGGTPCEAVCSNAIASGMSNPNIACRVVATSCAATDKCEGQSQ